LIEIPALARPTRSPLKAAGLAALLLLLVVACRAGAGEESLLVKASAYNSLAAQTNDQPTLTAWGDRLKPGMKSIAVSRDLIELGLGHGVRVRIEGLAGEYVVRDKMARRWKKKIDIYMGEDVAAALAWGVREVRIVWAPDS
jgi:3D (Asp-Asp-Asp) domain-containing protein